MKEKEAGKEAGRLKKSQRKKEEEYLQDYVARLNREYQGVNTLSFEYNQRDTALRYRRVREEEKRRRLRKRHEVEVQKSMSVSEIEAAMARAGIETEWAVSGESIAPLDQKDCGSCYALAMGRVLQAQLGFKVSA